ncbi:MAG TPA: aldehyde dehydrogenase family protein [Thermoleophilaceae bacterium]|nr:aldehyde dehydrogenase family protein [Thermoleophilaceae bacterium]
MTVETESQASANGDSKEGMIAVENPATGEVVAHVPIMGPDEVEAMVASAREAQPAWDALGFEGRAEVMYDARAWLLENRERMIETIVEETGKTREDTVLSEIFFIADSLGFWAKQGPKYLADERVRAHSPLLFGKRLVKRYRPMGVIGVIGPWNYPLTNSFGDCIPALVAGNAVVLKPSEVTPLTSLLMADGMRSVGLDERLFQIATGEGETGSALIDHVDMIMFTGSTRTGRRVMERAARTLTPVSLELGGKDPMIVLADADIDRAANTAVYWSMANGGQICQAVERVYVEAPVYDEFVGKVVERTQALRQGVPGAAGSVDVGAVTFGPQIDIVEGQVNDAVEKGAKVLVGGKRGQGPGRFFEPTVLVDVDHSMEIMTEETFGPTLPIMRVADEDEAVRMANDSRYGLNSSVFTKDIERGERVARRIEAGSTCVNDCITNYAAQELPFGGVGESGIGSRHGASGIQKYCKTQSLLITRFAGKKEPYFYPYTPRRTKLLERLMMLLYGRRPKRRR